MDTINILVQEHLEFDVAIQLTGAIEAARRRPVVLLTDAHYLGRFGLLLLTEDGIDFLSPSGDVLVTSGGEWPLQATPLSRGTVELRFADGEVLRFTDIGDRQWTGEFSHAINELATGRNHSGDVAELVEEHLEPDVAAQLTKATTAAAGRAVILLTDARYDGTFGLLVLTTAGIEFLSPAGELVISGTPVLAEPCGPGSLAVTISDGSVVSFTDIGDRDWVEEFAESVNEHVATRTDVSSTRPLSVMASVSSAPSLQGEAHENPHRTRNLVLAALGVLVVIGIFTGSSTGGAGTGSGSDQKLTAFDMCKDFVKDRLKAPSSAKFRNFFQDDGEVVVDGSGSGPYTVVSSVDSQNGFGAQLRTDFTCRVTNTSGDNWRLDSISLG